MTTLKPLVCGSCGAMITVSPGSSIARCEFCKATFELPAAPQEQPPAHVASATPAAGERWKPIAAYVLVLVVFVVGGVTAIVASSSSTSSTAAPVASSSKAHKSATGKYKVGDPIVVDWHGSPYDATVLAVLAADRYRIHYDGWSSSWDEDVPVSSIEGLR